MQKTINSAQPVPTANIAVNKSRLKVYKHAGNLPTYYLEKASEFQLELFNPTRDAILAKITLNGNLISQGGIVLNPGQRIFLDRYLDVPKKFLFDTYEVSNTQETLEAIQNNGDVKIQFYRERTLPTFPIVTTTYTQEPYWSNGFGQNINNNPFKRLYRSSNVYGSLNSDYTASYSVQSPNLNMDNSTGVVSFANLAGGSPTKSIETGRIEKGSHSDQKFAYVDKDFEYYAFHTIEYKLLPTSQKINIGGDLSKIRRYCTTCGSKLGKTDNFCGKCGKKA